MKNLTTLIISTLFVLMVVPVFSTTIHIPEDYSTIQGGIDASSDGDTVLVSAGTYVENINFNGKNIVVQGEDRETTIIDGNQSGSVVTFSSGENETAILSGFTITNGYAGYGGGIFAASEESIFFTQYDNSAGTLSVHTANLGGDEPAASGTGVLIEIQMNVISTSSSELTFSGSEVFRDPENNNLSILESVNGLISSP